MRAFLILLILTFLPLQFSTAAVVACCGHVGAKQESQSTHHQPAHYLAVEGVNDAATGGGSFDLDCGICHANCAAAVTSTTATLADPAGIEPIAHLVESILPPWHARPYRPPQWAIPDDSGWSAFT